MRARVVLVGLALIVAVAAGTVAWRQAREASGFAGAVALAPVDSQRIGFTDWAGVRAELGAAGLGRLLERGYDADLTSASALGSSATALESDFGISPANLDWELFAQAPDGAALLLRVPGSVSFSALGERLARLGFTRPASPTGVWDGGGDLIASLGGHLTPELQHWVLLEDERLVVTSDTRAYAATAAAAARGDGDRVDGLDAVVEPTGQPLSAVVLSGAYACERLAMAQADEPDQRGAAALIEAAGPVNPLTGFALSQQPGGQARAVLGFETDDQARLNADSRAALAAGPAPGQGGDFADRFTLAGSTATGRSVVLELDPRPGAYVVSDLSSGPVLFATC